MTMVVESDPPAQRDSPLTLRQRGMLQVLGEFANRDQVVETPIADLAKRAGTSRGTVLRLLVELEDVGAILRRRDSRQPMLPTRITLTRPPSA